MNQTHYRISLFGYGISPTIAQISLPLSGDAVSIQVRPYDYTIHETRTRRSMGGRQWIGISTGGVLGYSIVQTNWMQIPGPHRNLFEELDGHSVRVEFLDVVVAQMQSDVKLSIYGSDGIPTEIPQRRVQCTGIAFGSFDIDCTMHGIPLDQPRMGRGADYSRRAGGHPTARDILRSRR